MAIYSTPPPPPPPHYSIIPRVTIEGTQRPHFRRRPPPCFLLLTFIRTTIQACPEEEEEIMGNTLRCCIACMLPCGALDVVRVLHADGRVEYGGRITAGEVMKAIPKHVLAQPICEAIVKQRPSFLHPETELQRGKIYLLVPTYHLRKQSKSKPKKKPTTSATTEQRLPPKPEVRGEGKDRDNLSSPVRSSDKMLCRSKLLGGHQRSVRSSKRSGGTVWRPMLDCIQETGEDLLMYR